MRARIIAAVLAVPLFADAAPKKARAPVPAVPAVLAQPAGASKPAEPLINSDLNGRDLLFITDAIDLGKALAYLEEQTPRASDPSLRGFSDELVKALAAQSAVLNTVAEMRQIKIPEGQSATEKRIAERCAKLEGIKLDKAILDAFLEVDLEALTAYELGVTSKDATIRKLAEQTLPQIREHLLVVRAMAGIAPKQTAGATAPPPVNATRPEAVPPPLMNAPFSPGPKPIPASALAPTPLPASAPMPKPAFRTNVRLPSDKAPTTGQ